MRFRDLAATALVALALAACGNSGNSVDQLSTDADFSDAEVSAALGGNPSEGNTAASDNSAAKAE